MLSVRGENHRTVATRVIADDNLLPKDRADEISTEHRRRKPVRCDAPLIEDENPVGKCRSEIEVADSDDGADTSGSEKPYSVLVQARPSLRSDSLDSGATARIKDVF